MRFVTSFWIWLWFYLSESFCEGVTYYFAGGTINWRPLERPYWANYAMVLEPRLSWAGGSSSQNTNNCYHDGLFPRHSRYHQLVTRHSRSSNVRSVLFRCSDFNSGPYGWSSLRGSLEIYTPDADVTISFTSNTCAYKESGIGCGILLARANLAVRADTGRVNTPPITNMLTWVQLNRRANMVIKIPVWDADGDIVRCRWATSFNYECDTFCNHFPATLDEDACTLTYRAWSVSGYRVVSLQIEDFARSNPTTRLSSTPLQFIVNLVDQTDNQKSVAFSGSTVTDGSLLVYENYPPTSINIAAVGTGICVSHINSMTPTGFLKSGMWGSPAVWNWTPSRAYSAASDHIACFQAISCEGGTTASEVRCIHLQETNEEESTSTSSTSSTSMTTSMTTSGTSLSTTATTDDPGPTTETPIMCVTQSVTHASSSGATTLAGKEAGQSSDVNVLPFVIGGCVGGAVLLAIGAFFLGFFIGRRRSWGGRTAKQDASSPKTADAPATKPSYISDRLPAPGNAYVNYDGPEPDDNDNSGDAGPEDTYEELTDTRSPGGQQLYSEYLTYSN